jgi:hypothetical protein
LVIRLNFRRASYYGSTVVNFEMTMISGSKEQQEDLPESSAPMRLRPGERPVWVDAEVWQAQWGQWRAQAAERGVGVDGLIATWIEFRGVVDDLENLGMSDAAELLGGLAGAELREDRLAPSPALQAWVAALSGTSPSVAYMDELPELMLSGRLWQWPSAKQALGTPIESASITLAVKLEVAAARRGLTMQAWVLEAVLRAVG